MYKRQIENYLLEREQLELVLLLIDGEVGPTALDKQSIDWFRHIGVPLRLVATKQDKVKSSKPANARTNSLRVVVWNPRKSVGSVQPKGSESQSCAQSSTAFSPSTPSSRRPDRVICRRGQVCTLGPR